MTDIVLITGFGPFPGAPYNPTAPLVAKLSRRRRPAFAGVRRIGHVFRVSYQAVDQELPTLLQRERPNVLLMFGLAARTKHMRVETLARNALTLIAPDSAGRRPRCGTIMPGAPAILALSTPAQRLVMAARSTGVAAALSRDAGRYLCNYLCWRAVEAAAHDGGLRVVAFIHVPAVGRVRRPRSPGRRPPLTLDALARAGEAIMRAALCAARASRQR